MKKNGKRVILHILFLALVFPSCLSFFPVRFVGGGAGTLFVLANVLSVVLQWFLWRSHTLPTTASQLLLQNGIVFSRRFLVTVGTLWLLFISLTLGFGLLVFQPFALLAFLVWFVCMVWVCAHTARTQTRYGIPKDDTSPKPAVLGRFWPTIVFFILISFCVLFSIPSVRTTALYVYNFYIKGEIKVAGVADYQNDHTVCEDYEKNTHSYANCKLERYATSDVYKAEQLDCSNMYVYGKHCSDLQVVQKAFLTKDDSLCTTIQGGNYYALCLGEFPQSTAWKSGCEYIMNFVLNTAPSTAPRLVQARCLSRENANLTMARSGLGRLFDSWGEYEVPYKKHYMELGRTNSIHSPQAPVWFNDWGVLDKRTVTYLKSIDADPNNTDDFGRTALVLFMDHLAYLVDSTVESLPKRQRPGFIEVELQPLQHLLAFGVDPYKKDIIGKDAFAHAQNIESELLKKRVLELLEGK